MNKSTEMNEEYRLLELYCGIGGIRYALEAAKIPFQIVAAIDINPVSNDIYQHNFGSSGHFQKNILSLTVSDIEKMKVDIITMSPPCQPFTRLGLHKDTDDTRSSSFLHVLNIISQLQYKPRYVLLENVKGFEISMAHSFLLETLRKCRYRYQEYLLSPKDFGIPNSRLRYYLIARLHSTSLPLEPSQILYTVSNVKDTRLFVCSSCSLNMKANNNKCPIKHFLESNSSCYFKSYLVPDGILSKYWSVLDIVDEKSYNSCCFTKAYNRYAHGTGSVLTLLQDSKERIIFDLVSKSEDKMEQLKLLKQLKLRYFTPKEIANILCFPNKFDFPPHIKKKQKYKSLGNSLNVFVVAVLFLILFQDNSVN